MKSDLPIDVTDELRAKGCLVGPDRNDEDRVYRVGEGKDAALVKVKTFHDRAASRHGAEVYRVTGAMAGADGKALRRADGSPAVQSLGRSLTVQADQDVDLVVEIEKARFACVRDTLRAEQLARAAEALTGVGIS